MEKHCGESGPMLSEDRKQSKTGTDFLLNVQIDKKVSRTEKRETINRPDQVHSSGTNGRQRGKIERRKLYRYRKSHQQRHLRDHRSLMNIKGGWTVNMVLIY